MAALLPCGRGLALMYFYYCATAVHCCTHVWFSRTPGVVSCPKQRALEAGRGVGANASHDEAEQKGPASTAYRRRRPCLFLTVDTYVAGGMLLCGWCTIREPTPPRCGNICSCYFPTKPSPGAPEPKCKNSSGPFSDDALVIVYIPPHSPSTPRTRMLTPRSARRPPPGSVNAPAARVPEA